MALFKCFLHTSSSINATTLLQIENSITTHVCLVYFPDQLLVQDHLEIVILTFRFFLFSIMYWDIVDFEQPISVAIFSCD